MGKIALLLGGSNESMIARADALLKVEGIGDVVVTGLYDEMEFMTELLKSRGVSSDRIKEVYSYDTVTNIENSIPYFGGEEEIVCSSSPWHLRRVKLILRKHSNLKNRFLFVKSGEKEVWYAWIGYLIYATIGPNILRVLAERTRK